MFEDCRSRRVIFLAHCLLNQNSISDGTAVYPAAFKDVLRLLMEADIGVVQLPCPELCCLGLDRGDEKGAERPVTAENTRIRRELQRGEPARRLEALVGYAMYQLEEYRRHGFEILGIVGVNRSPSCGVETTSDNDAEIPGMGLFMGRLAERLAEAGASVPMLGLKASDDAASRLKALL